MLRPRREAPSAERKPSSIIQPRPRAGAVHRALLALAFALIGTPILMAGALSSPAADVPAGEASPVTVRVPLFFGRAGDQAVPDGIAVARGGPADPAALARAREHQPAGWGAAAAHAAALFLAALLYTARLRRSRKGRLLRVQAALLGLQLALAALSAAALLLTELPSVALPAALLVVCCAAALDVGAAMGAALVAALVLGGLAPFDPGVIAVLAMQGLCAALVLGDPRRGRRIGKRRVLAAGAAGGAAAALGYIVLSYLAWGAIPAAELADPLAAGWLAAGLAGLVAGAAAIGFLPAFQRLLGDITLGALIELEDLSHPLLVQIAESSPGTWQHSLAMANMAQIAANAIGADGRLVRVGAYYHDLGKSLQPKYFIENLSGGEASPHDALPPPVSCDAIFAHVTEGVRVARRHGLHERVIDFMHMHHGDGLLEYFWVKCQEQGNPNRLVEADFRYPGVKPDSPETAILAICDAVEAASRTLRSPDAASIEGLVQRIVYGKLHLGQLDDSGLTVADLRVISSSLMETIKHAHHGRIEYQWQRAARESAEREASQTPPARPRGAPAGQVLAAEPRPDAAEPSVEPPRADASERMTATARLLTEPRLDSLDAPRPSSRARGPARGSRRLENAATEPMRAEPAPTVSLVRPPTAAEVAAATHPGMAPPAGSGAILAAASDRALPLAPSAALDAAATLSLLEPEPPAANGEPGIDRGDPGDEADLARPARPQRS